MRLKTWLLGTALLSASYGLAQDQLAEKTPDLFSIHGNLDGYYGGSFHGLKKPLTSFTASNERFSLGMASLQLGYTSKKAGVVVDLGFGPRARDFSYTDDGDMAAIKQAYVYYEPVSGLRFAAGTWATHIGYEVLDPALNANYSMSYLFSTGPFSNTGLKAEYSFGAQHIMVGVSNPTDYRIVPEDVYNKKTVIARYSYEKPSGMVLALNYSGGKQVDTTSVQQLDGVAILPVSRRIDLGWNGSISFRKLQGGQENKTYRYWGQAVYLRAKFVDKWSLGLREEYYSDKNGVSVIPLDGSVWSSTATLSYREGGFTIMPEIRWDRFSTPVMGGAERDMLYGLVAVTYQF